MHVWKLNQAGLASGEYRIRIRGAVCIAAEWLGAGELRNGMIRTSTCAFGQPKQCNDAGERPARAKQKELSMAKKKSAATQPATAASRSKAPKPAKTTKLAQLEAMLRRPDGATIEQIGKALAWQAHSVRGAIAGALKKKGCVVSNEIGDAGRRIYRIA